MKYLILLLLLPILSVAQITEPEASEVWEPQPRKVSVENDMGFHQMPLFYLMGLISITGNQEMKVVQSNGKSKMAL